VLNAGPTITWWKGIRVPDGEGRSWLIETQALSGSANISLWAGQVKNGQELVFHQAKFAGSHRIVYRLGDLGRLPPGSQVTFSWLQDSSDQQPLTGVVIGASPIIDALVHRKARRLTAVG
jgi:hypothetical protein